MADGAMPWRAHLSLHKIHVVQPATESFYWCAGRTEYTVPTTVHVLYRAVARGRASRVRSADLVATSGSARPQAQPCRSWRRSFGIAFRFAEIRLVT
jgi:hypothetical protein